MSSEQRYHTSGRLRGFLAATGVVLGGLVAAWGLVEIVARITYEAPWYEQLLMEQEAAELVRGSRNRFDLRDRDYASPKPTNHVRVLFLGDSFTYGLGVHRDSTFVEIVERRLNLEPPLSGVESFDVLNGGKTGSLTRRWVQVSKMVREPFDPDLVVVVFFLRNGTELRAKEDFFEPVRDEIAARNQASFAYRLSYAVRFVRDRLDRRDVSQQYTQRFLDAYLGEKRSDTKQWRFAQRNLRSIREGTKDGAVALVVFPILADLGDSYPFRPIVDEIVRFGRENGFPTLDLLEAFAGRNARDLWVSELNQHPNERGHVIAADAIEPFVRDLLAGQFANRD